jgi:hypothetical protein
MGIAKAKMGMRSPLSLRVDIWAVGRSIPDARDPGKTGSLHAA